MNRLNLCWLRLLMVSGLLFVCTGPVLAEQTRFAKSLPDGGRVELVFAAAPLVTMTEIPFSVALTGSTGMPIRDAAVGLDLDMPAMPMPPNHPQATWQDGAYRGTAVFTMAGEWIATMNIQRPGYDRVTTDINLGIVRMQ